MSAASSWSSTQFVAGSSGSSTSVGLGGRGREQRRGRAAQHARVDRLHEREVDVGAARDERVVAAVEQQQDAGPREAAARLLEAEVDRDRDAAHVADLEVEHHEVGLELGERVAHVLAAGDLDDLLAGPDERRPHLVAHPLRVGGHEDRRHRGGSLDGDGAEPSAGDEQDRPISRSAAKS